MLFHWQLFLLLPINEFQYSSHCCQKHSRVYREICQELVGFLVHLLNKNNLEKSIVQFRFACVNCFQNQRLSTLWLKDLPIVVWMILRMLQKVFSLVFDRLFINFGEFFDSFWCKQSCLILSLEMVQELILLLESYKLS